MRILVVSDSHLYHDYLNEVIKKYKNKVDLMIHCGDSSLPLHDHVMKNFDIAVLGNHDYAPYPTYKTYHDICVTHGHLYQVYGGYQQLIELCQKHQCHICFHGHTHVPTHQIHQGIHFINPGSLMMNRGSYGFGTYAIVDINQDHVNVHYYHHETHQLVDEDFILSEGLELLHEFEGYVKKQGY